MLGPTPIFCLSARHRTGLRNFIRRGRRSRARSLKIMVSTRRRRGRQPAAKLKPRPGSASSGAPWKDWWPAAFFSPAALQSATVASALPFTVVVLALVLSLYLGMREDLAQREAHSGQKQLPAAQPASGQTWQRRLGLMLTAATEKDIRRFMETQVRPALDQVAAELTSRGRQSEVLGEADGAIALRSPAEGIRDFVYGSPYPAIG
jgi:hypothetical protein